MGKSSPDSPAPRDLSAEIAQILSQAGPLLASNAQYSPQNAGLDLRNLQLALQGAPEGTQTIHEPRTRNAWRNSRTGEISYADQSPPITYNRPNVYGHSGAGQEEQQQDSWVPWQVQDTVSRDVTTPAVPGLLGQLRDTTREVGAISSEANTTARTAAYADLRNLNPGQAQLMDQLTQTASSDLAAGDRLTPEQSYRITNPVRSDWARRGLGTSAPGELDEALQLFGGGQELYQQRRANALGAAGANSELYTMPAMQYAGDPTGAAANFLGGAGSYARPPSILEILTGYQSDLANTNFNAEAAENINRSNANNATTAGYTGAAVGIGSAAIIAA